MTKFIFSLSIIILISCGPNVMVNSGYDSDKGLVQMDRNPEFPGGWGKFEKYFKKNITYPREARLNSEEGQVIVSFVVTKQGQIVETQIVEGVSELIDKEALRIISNMPKWKPAILNGDVVSVRINIPMEFKLP